MAGSHKNHDFHILPPSPWPLAASVSALIAAIGLVFWLHGSVNPLFFLFGLVALIGVSAAWWADVIDEAEHQGHHKPIVVSHHKIGVGLFIASEVMFFVAWFWAFFDASLFPGEVAAVAADGLAKANLGAVKQIVRAEATGAVWPPKDVHVFDAMRLPLLNTLILLLSGCTLTYGHHALIHNDRKGLTQGLGATVILGIVFTFLQGFEYMHAPFPFKEGIYGAVFFMATGFHGAHVIIGTLFLAVCYFRAVKGHFKPDHHFGLEAAAWYWHFVDVVWLFLFVSIYIWGNYGAPIATH